MITQFNEFVNEGFFSSENDEYVKKFFEEIKENFDFDNFDYYISSGKAKTEWYEYNHDGIELLIEYAKDYIDDVFKTLTVSINNKEIECSKILKFKILKYFNRKSKKIEKREKLNQTEELKDILDPGNRTANKYNL